jgi:hypothetical protein
MIVVCSCAVKDDAARSVKRQVEAIWDAEDAELLAAALRSLNHYQQHNLGLPLFPCLSPLLPLERDATPHQIDKTTCHTPASWRWLMPYSAEMSRSNPSCLIFLIDQSSSMAEPFGAQPEKPKAEGVADGINRLVQNLILKCAKGDGIRDYFHVGVIGYGGRVAWALGGNLAGQKLVPMSVLANNPLKVEQRSRKADDGSGGAVEQKFKFPIWFEAVAGGRTPMCQAISEATQAMNEFIGRYPDSFPPLVINISDGKATDGNPELPAHKLRQLTTSDGHALMFNAHLSSAPARPIEFPSQESQLPDPAAAILFRMSSLLPPKLRDAAKSEGFRVDDQTRGFVFNADLVSVIRFLVR